MKISKLQGKDNNAKHPLDIRKRKNERNIGLKENFTLFCLNWPRMGFYNPIYQNELFFLPKLTFQHHLRKIYIWLFIY